MEYFKKLQCYKPKKAIIDSPISIEEVALLQNSVDKDILGRIKFINRSQQSIIAIFVHLSAFNIAGENVPVEKERYIYQDMKIDSGELYGNKIPLHLPDDTRLLTVKLEKIVFENGEIWDASTGIECEYISQEEIDIPAYVIEKVQEELLPHFSHMEYVHYFYEEGQNFWECTCGKINGMLNKKCSFCQNDRQSQKEYLVQDKMIPLIAKKEQEKQAEDEEKARQKAEAERLKKEEQQREYERKQKEWAKLDAEREKERQELERRRKKQKRTWIYIGIITVIAICVIMIVSFYHQKKVNNEIYNNAQELLKSGDYDKAIEEWNRILSYEDSETQIKETTYEKAMNLFENKQYQNAIDEWEKIEDYKDSKEMVVQANAEWVYKPVDEYLDKNEFDDARKTLERMFDVHTDENAKKKLDEINQIEYGYNQENIKQYFVNPDSKDAIMISNILACKNKNTEYFERYTGISLADLETYESKYPNYKGEYLIKYTKNDMNLFDQDGSLEIYFKKESIEDEYLLNDFFFSFDKQLDNMQEFCISNVKKMLGKDYDSYRDDHNYGVSCDWKYEFLSVSVMDIGLNTNVAATDICFE